MNFKFPKKTYNPYTWGDSLCSHPSIQQAGVPPERLKKLERILRDAGDLHLLETLFRLGDLPIELQFQILFPLLSELVEPSLKICSKPHISIPLSLPRGYRDYSLSLSPNGQWAAIGTDTGGWIWDLNEGNSQPIQEINPHLPHKYVKQVSFSLDGAFLASVTANPRPSNLDIRRFTANELIPYKSYHFNDFIFTFAFSPDNKTIAIGATHNQEPKIFIQDLYGSNQEPLYTLPAVNNIDHISFNRTGTRIAWVENNYPLHVSSVHIWDLPTRKQVDEIQMQGLGLINGFSLDPRGDEFAVSLTKLKDNPGKPGYTYRVYNIPSKRFYDLNNDSYQPIQSLTYSPDGLLAAQLFAGLKVWYPKVSLNPVYEDMTIKGKSNVSFDKMSTKMALATSHSMEIYNLPWIQYPHVYKEIYDTTLVSPKAMMLLIILAKLHNANPAEPLLLNQNETLIFNTLPSALRLLLKDCFHIQIFGDGN